MADTGTATLEAGGGDDPMPTLSLFDRQAAGDLIRKIMDCDDELNRILDLLEEGNGEEEADPDT